MTWQKEGTTWGSKKPAGSKLLNAPITEQDKPRVLESLVTVDADVRRLDELLRSTDLAPGPERVKMISEWVAHVREVLNSKGAAAFTAEVNATETQIGPATSWIFGLGAKLTPRADAESEADARGERLPLPEWSRLFLRHILGGGPEYESRLYIVRNGFDQRPKGGLEGIERRDDALNVGDVQAASLGHLFPVFHIESNIRFLRAVHSAPAKITIAAMKLHNTIVTEI